MGVFSLDHVPAKRIRGALNDGMWHSPISLMRTTGLIRNTVFAYICYMNGLGMIEKKGKGQTVMYRKVNT